MPKKKKPDIYEWVLGAENVKSAGDLYKFTDKIILSVFELLGSGSGGRTEIEFETEPFTEFLRFVHAIAELMSEMENRLALARKTEAFFRASRRRCKRATAKVQHSLDFLADADQILTEEQKELRPGVLRMRECRKELKRLHKEIIELEADNAAFIHPNLRNKRERLIAKNSILHSKHPKYPATPGSQKVVYDVVKMLDKQITKYARSTGTTIPVNRTNAFIGKFLEVMGASTSSDNIRRIRKLNKPQKKALLSSAASL
jgi:hypothetical protein